MQQSLRVATIAMDPRDGNAVVVLEHTSTGRAFPVWVADREAGLIADALAGRRGSRPGPQELLFAVSAALGAQVRAARITGIVGGVVQAELVVAHADDELAFDARPSDVILLALRADAPILVDELLLDQVAARVREAMDRVSPSTRVAAEPLQQSPAERWNQLLAHLAPGRAGRDTTEA